MRIYPDFDLPIGNKLENDSDEKQEKREDCYRFDSRSGAKENQAQKLREDLLWFGTMRL